MKRLRVTITVLVSLTIAGAGCASVPAYERELLARPAMEGKEDGSWKRFGSHIAGAREAALDPSSSGGGGCGCN